MERQKVFTLFAINVRLPQKRKGTFGTCVVSFYGIEEADSGGVSAVSMVWAVLIATKDRRGFIKKNSHTRDSILPRPSSLL